MRRQLARINWIKLQWLKIRTRINQTGVWILWVIKITVWVIYSSFSSFSCHKCARWSHPILTCLTFHEIDFATNVPSVLFNRTIVGSCLYLLMPFYYRYDCIHICRVWYELFEKQMKYYIVQRVALGVCFSIFGGLRNNFLHFYMKQVHSILGVYKWWRY